MSWRAHVAPFTGLSSGQARLFMSHTIRTSFHADFGRPKDYDQIIRHAFVMQLLMFLNTM